MPRGRASADDRRPRSPRLRCRGPTPGGGALARRRPAGRSARRRVGEQRRHRQRDLEHGLRLAVVAVLLLVEHPRELARAMAVELRPVAVDAQPLCGAVAVELERRRHHQHALRARHEDEHDGVPAGEEERAHGRQPATGDGRRRGDRDALASDWQRGRGIGGVRSCALHRRWAWRRPGAAVAWPSGAARAARRDVAQPGSAPRSGRGGRGFESRHPDTHAPSALGRGRVVVSGSPM